MEVALVHLVDFPRWLRCTCGITFLKIRMIIWWKEEKNNPAIDCKPCLSGHVLFFMCISFSVFASEWAYKLPAKHPGIQEPAKDTFEWRIWSILQIWMNWCRPWPRVVMRLAFRCRPRRLQSLNWDTTIGVIMLIFSLLLGPNVQQGEGSNITYKKMWLCEAMEKKMALAVATCNIHSTKCKTKTTHRQTHRWKSCLTSR